MNWRPFILAIVAVPILLLLAPITLSRADEQNLAIKGYDPVAYFTDKRPMVGDPRYQAEWDGATYRFTSAEHLALFKQDPERYLPQYKIWCSASVATGVKFYGNPEYWIVVDGRLYLFGTPDGPSLMRADPVAMKSAADKNWPKVSQLPNPPRPQ